MNETLNNHSIDRPDFPPRRIVIITDSAERHFYFANQIIENSEEVVGVLTGAKKIHESKWLKLRKKLRRKVLYRNLLKFLLDKVFRSSLRALDREKNSVEERFFGSQKSQFMANHSHLWMGMIEAEHRSVNSDFYLEKIRILRPDIIVVMGTCLISARLIELAPLMLNIHTGLSPYYRGGATNLWPFIDRRLEYCGVTVHRMSTAIDAGDIFASGQIPVVPNDTFSRVNSQAIVMGTQMMVDVICKLRRGELPAVPQWVKGKLFHNYHLTGWAAYRYLRGRDAAVSQYFDRLADDRVDRPRTIGLE